MERNRNQTPSVTTSLLFPGIFIDPKFLPYALGDFAIIDRATSEEILKIKDLINRKAVVPAMKPFQLFECDASEDRSNGLTQYLNPLKTEEWRYYVLRTNDNGLIASVVDSIGTITEPPFEVGTLSWGSEHVTWRHHSLANHFSPGPFEPTRHFVESTFRQIVSLHMLYIRNVERNELNEANFPEIGRAMEMLRHITLLPRSSPLVIVGLFSIMEMLITHKPGNKDIGDSISHQIKKKMILLEKRFDIKLDYSIFGQSVSADKIWATMYTYRSQIAHGGQLDFSKDLKLLVSQYHADMLLKQAIRALIRGALVEPQLYFDLREC